MDAGSGLLPHENQNRVGVRVQYGKQKEEAHQIKQICGPHGSGKEKDGNEKGAREEGSSKEEAARKKPECKY
jgi:hypothetical protein